MVGWRKERRKEGNDKNRWMVGSGGNSGERRMVGREGRGMVGRARKGGEVEGKEGWRDGDGREGKEGWKEGVVGRGKKRKRKEFERDWDDEE